MSTEIPCPAPRQSATAPATAIPSGACDTHAHVFGPASRYPYQDERDYTPPDAPVDALLALHATLGITRGVLTQASVLGTDNRAILDAVARHPRRLRAVVAFGSGVGETEVDRLHQAGARGLRLNLVDRGGMPFESFAEIHRVAAMIGERGWHLELLAKAHQMDEHAGDLARLPVPFSLGHYGYMPTGRGVDDPGFQRLLAWMRDGKAWVKTTGGYRITARRSTPYDDIQPYAEALLNANPRRVLWGSDWPHVMCRIEMPDDGAMFDDVLGWMNRDVSLMRQVLVDNPAALYGFDADGVN